MNIDLIELILTNKANRKKVNIQKDYVIGLVEKKLIHSRGAEKVKLNMLFSDLK